MILEVKTKPNKLKYMWVKRGKWYKYLLSSNVILQRFVSFSSGDL